MKLLEAKSHWLSFDLF